MIEQIPDLPDNVLGFTAKGQVSADDYESVIIPAVEERFARHEKVRLLYHIGDEFTDFETAAMWDDTKIGMKHLAGWERIAIVSDVEWLKVVIKAFGVIMPGQVRVFPNSELAEATRWISEV